MTDNKDNDKAKQILDDADYEYEKHIYEEEKKRQNEIDEKKRSAEAERKKRIEQARKEHDRQLAKERIELMKLKSGDAVQEATEPEDAEDNAEQAEESESVEVKSSFKKKADNFFYQNKWWLGLAAVVIIVGGFLLYGFFTKKEPDLTVIVIADNGLESKQEKLREFFEEYTEDVDGNGYVYVSVISIPLGKKDDTSVEQTEFRSQFLTLLHSTEDMLVITDSDTDEYYMEIMDHDLRSKFPGNKYIDENGFSMNMKLIADRLEFDEMPNDVHLSIRQPVKTVEDSLETAKKNYEKSFACMKRMVDDLTEKAIQSNDKGLKPKEKKADSSSAKS